VVAAAPRQSTARQHPGYIKAAQHLAAELRREEEEIPVIYAATLPWQAS
jgi:hypothetical protein